MIRAKNRYHIILPAVAATITMAIVAACGLYSKKSPTLLPDLTVQLSELAMQQGTRSEAGGDLDSALDHYQRALAGHFHGPQNRIHVEKRCGVILWKLEQYEAAIPHLMRAQDSPHRSLNGYKPLVASLHAVGRDEDAERVIQRWLAEAVEEDASRADALQAWGQLALHRSNPVEAQEHLEAAIALVPGHPALVGLAQLHHDNGDRAEAIKRLTTYLSAAVPRGDIGAIWDLLTTWEHSR